MTTDLSASHVSIPAAPAATGPTAPNEGTVHGGVRLVLRVEAAVVLALAVALYQQSGGGWGLFAALFLLPDLLMLGYLAGPRVGAASYNAAHTYASALALGALGFTLVPGVRALALIWLAHIAFDRMVGYGLKYGDRFGHTHLGIVGGTRRQP